MMAMKTIQSGPSLKLALLLTFGSLAGPLGPGISLAADKAAAGWRAEIYFDIGTESLKTDYEYPYELADLITRYTCAPGRVFDPLNGNIQDETNTIAVSADGAMTGNYAWSNQAGTQKSDMKGSLSGQVNLNSGELVFSGTSEFVWDIAQPNPAYGHYTKSMTYTAKGSYTPNAANLVRPLQATGTVSFTYRHTGGPQAVYDKSFTGSFPFAMDFYGPSLNRLPSIEVLDANPQFNGLYDFTDVVGNAKSTDHAKRAAQVAATNTQERYGAAADGTSLLLLRRELPGPGKVEFSLFDAGGGALFPLESDPFIGGIRSSVSVDAVATEEKGKLRWWAFALYVPPAAFGEGRNFRPVKVGLRFKPSAGGADVEAEQTFNLIRPPVVLAHGTFDEPISCWKTKDVHSPETMWWTLESRMYDVFLLDWEETNGHKDPSSFQSNAQTVWINRGGIKEALETLRQKKYAVTQVDVVAHSQGGVIVRAYANGVWTGSPRDAGDPHYSLPRQCAKSGCWYHRLDNWARGDVHRLITVSTTHMGSDACRVLEGFIEVGQRDQTTEAWESILANLLLVGSGLQGNEGLAKAKEYYARLGTGPLTEGYRDQTPGSKAYQAIGPTAIPSHAIACTCEDADMMMDDALYQNRWGTIWNLASADLLAAVFKNIGQEEDGEDLWHLKEKQTGAEAELTANARRLRAAAFGNCPNDCTVREESSFGGIPEGYRTVIPNVLHGSAPRFASVQQCVLKLLEDDGKKFCDEGFPAAFGPPVNRKYVPPAPAPN